MKSPLKQKVISGLLAVVLCSLIGSCGKSSDDSEETQSTPETKKGSNLPLAEDFISLRKKYNATGKDAILEKRLEKGKYYFIGGSHPDGSEFDFSVTQVGDEFILISSGTPAKPWAILNFDNPEALSGVRISTGNSRLKTLGKAIGKFIEFRAVSMANGAEERFPVFSCAGLKIDADFINTEALSK